MLESRRRLDRTRRSCFAIHPILAVGRMRLVVIPETCPATFNAPEFALLFSGTVTANTHFLYLTTTGRKTGLSREIEIWFVQADSNPTITLPRTNREILSGTDDSGKEPEEAAPKASRPSRDLPC
jgi:hypothetical protein